MKVYVDELPKLCAYCPYYYGNSQGAVCKLTGIMTKWNETLGEMQSKCPLQSLADYTKQVRKEVLDQVYKVFTTESMWKELKDWWLQSGTCKELRDCLDAIAEDPSVENIVMRFGRDRNLYEWLKELQSKDN